MKTLTRDAEVRPWLRSRMVAVVATLSLLCGFATSPVDAVFRGDLDKVKRALDSGEVKIGDRFDSGFTLLHAAAIRGDVPIAELLVERGAQVNDLRNDLKRTPLFLASMNRRQAMVEWLLDHGARDSLSEKDAGGITPLLVAVSTVRLQKDAYATNALGHIFASPKVEESRPDLAIVSALLRAGADPNGPRTPNGNTALHIAAWWGHSDVVSLLLSKGADPSLVNGVGHTAEQLARSAGKDETARLIAAAGGR